MKRTFLAAIFLVWGSALQAADIPIEIRWEGERPNWIAEVVGGAMTYLARDEAAHVFRGILSVNSPDYERRSFVVDYPGFRHPIDIRVHLVSPPVRFTIRSQLSASCTDVRVTAYSQTPSTLPDAIDWSIGASQLLSIKRPNDCDDNLRFRAVSARYRQSVRMGALSRGLFLVNPAVAEEYRQLARARGISVASEMGAYAVAEVGLEPAQLFAARDWALKQGNAARVAEIDDFMLQRIGRSEGVREIFRQQGVTRRGLLRQASYDVQRPTHLQAEPPRK
jgi:hypothetical protein